MKEVKPEEFKEKVIKLGADEFKVLHAIDLKEDWSFIGYWLQGATNPPKMEHVLVPKEILIADCN